MKLSLELADQGSVEHFARICTNLCRLCKHEVALRVTSDSLSFIIRDLPGENASCFSYTVPSQFFDKFTIKGYNEDYPEMILTLNMDAVSKALAIGDTHCKLKLTKKNDIPHLQVELFRAGVTHWVPARIVPISGLSLYTQPNIDPEQLSAVMLPDARNINKVFISFKNVGAKTFSTRISNSGELHISCRSDKASLVMYYEDLKVIPPPPTDQGEVPVEWVSAKLNLRTIQAIFSNFLSFATNSRVMFGVIPSRSAVLSAEVDDCRLEFVTSLLVNTDQPE